MSWSAILSDPELGKKLKELEEDHYFNEIADRNREKEKETR